MKMNAMRCIMFSDFGKHIAKNCSEGQFIKRERFSYGIGMKIQLPRLSSISAIAQAVVATVEVIRLYLGR